MIRHPCRKSISVGFGRKPLLRGTSTHSTMEFNRCILLLLMVSSTVLAEPCTEYNPIPDIHRRDPVYKLSDGEDPINDKTIVEGWYGDMTFKLLNEAPGFFKCGGHYPLWRSGTSGDVCTICMETNSDICAETFQIEMKTCNGYEVYYLLKPDVNRASYCFECEIPALSNHNYRLISRTVTRRDECSLTQ